jgi:CDP-4-dehydro-6-deoxyglucose reductase
MAGGTGFSPAKAMLEELLPKHAARSVHLFWGGRQQDDLYMDAEVRAWLAQYPQFRYTPVLSEPDANWNGETGFVHEAVLRAYATLSGQEMYLCGPPVMVQAGKKAFLVAGLDADHLFYDSFDYAFETWPKLES